MNGFSNRYSLWGVHDSAMGMSRSMETEEIAILRKNHALFSTGALYMRGVGCTEKTCFTHCLDINASFAQALHNGSGNVFV